MTDAAFMAAKVDLSSLYEGQLVAADRGVAICEGRYVVVRDEIAAGDTAATVRWSMLTPASVHITGPGRAELTQNGKKLSLIVEWNRHRWKCGHGFRTRRRMIMTRPNPGTVIVGFITPFACGWQRCFQRIFSTG
jgi:hypothetical protein